MRRHVKPAVFAGIVVIALLSLSTIWGQSDQTALAKVPVGAVVAQFTGRLSGGGGIDGEYELLGYLTFLEGLGTGVFAGEVSESKAQFALRSDRLRFQTLANGSLIHFGRLAVPATQPALIRLYYLASPDRDFSKPYTFAEGDLIGVLRTRGIQGSLTPALMFRADGSVTVDSASDFNLGDRKVNLKSIGESFVISLFGVPPSASEFADATSLSVPFSGVIRAADRFQDQVTITPGSGGFGPPK